MTIEKGCFWVNVYADEKAEPGYFYITKYGGFHKGSFSKQLEYVILTGDAIVMKRPIKTFRYGEDIESTPFFEEDPYAIFAEKTIVMSPRDLIDMGCNITGDRVLMIPCKEGGVDNVD